MSEKDIEGKKILERADKITNRLFKAWTLPNVSRLDRRSRQKYLPMP
jgi:hypothetical protein